MQAHWSRRVGVSLLVVAAGCLAATAVAAQAPPNPALDDPPAAVDGEGPAVGDAPAVPTVDDRETIETKGEIDDPAQKRLRWIIGGLVALAAVILVVTVWFWRATSPARGASDAEPLPPLAETASPVPEANGATVGRPADPLEGVRVVRTPRSLPAGQRAPIWADEHAAARAATASPPGATEAHR